MYFFRDVLDFSYAVGTDFYRFPSATERRKQHEL